MTFVEVVFMALVIAMCPVITSQATVAQTEGGCVEMFIRESYKTIHCCRFGKRLQ